VSLERPWFIKNSGFMEQIAPDDREAILAICKERSFTRGETIFRAGDPASRLHLIAQGAVKLVRPTADGNERILAICGRDDFVGEAFLRDAERYRADAIAMNDVITCPISREDFRRLAIVAPGFALTFTEVLLSNLARCEEQLGASADSVKVRVVKVLLQQIEQTGTRPCGGGWRLLETDLKHEDFAALAPASRVAVTMAFTALRKAEVLRGSRGRYELDVRGLQSLVGDVVA